VTKVYEVDGVVPVVDPTAFVHPDAVLIGDVIVGPRCFVGPLVVLRGDFGRVVLEAGSNIQDGSVAHGYPGRETLLGERGHVGHAAVLHTCVVGRDALIGIRAVLLDGSVVGEGAFVAAGSLVKADFEVPARTLVAGTPARVMRDLTDEELAWKANGTRLYEELGQLSLATLKPVEPLATPQPDRPIGAMRQASAVPLDDYRNKDG